MVLKQKCHNNENLSIFRRYRTGIIGGIIAQTLYISVSSLTGRYSSGFDSFSFVIPPKSLHSLFFLGWIKPVNANKISTFSVGAFCAFCVCGVTSYQVWKILQSLFHSLTTSFTFFFPFTPFRKYVRVTHFTYYVSFCLFLVKYNFYSGSIYFGKVNNILIIN